MDGLLRHLHYDTPDALPLALGAVISRQDMSDLTRAVRTLQFFLRTVRHDEDKITVLNKIYYI